MLLSVLSLLPGGTLPPIEAPDDTDAPNTSATTTTTTTSTTSDSLAALASDDILLSSVLEEPELASWLPSTPRTNAATISRTSSVSSSRSGALRRLSLAEADTPLYWESLGIPLPLVDNENFFLEPYLPIQRVRRP